MSLSEAIESGRFALLAEVDPPKGVNMDPFIDSVLGIKGRVDAVAVTDCSHAIMRMTPLAPCRMLVERNVETVMVINGRDRNRLSFQGDLLAARAMGVRNILLTEGQDPAVGDQPMARSSGDLGLEVMLQCVCALRAGKDLGGEPLDGICDFDVGAAVEVSDDINANKHRAEGLSRLAAQGVSYAVLGPSYDVNLVGLFGRAAAAAGVKLFASVMLLQSVAMIRYLNDLPGVPAIPHEYLRQMQSAPVKAQAGMEIAANLIKDLSGLCNGAVLIALGWGPRLPQFLDLIGR